MIDEPLLKVLTTSQTVKPPDECDSLLKSINDFAQRRSLLLEDFFATDKIGDQLLVLSYELGLHGQLVVDVEFMVLFVPLVGWRDEGFYLKALARELDVH